MGKNKFILAGNGHYENKGCEAIIRGTTKVLDAAYGNDTEYVVQSLFDSEEAYNCQKDNEFNDRITHVKIARDYKAPLYKKILGKLDLNETTRNFERKKYIHQEIFDKIPEAKAVLSVGGDNYSLNWGIPTTYTDIDDLALYYKKPIIIWGASVGPFSANPKYEKYMKNHLKKVTAIFAREDKTIEYLDSIGINDNVHRVSDPAFIMDPIKPDDFEAPENLEDSIGINICPLMARYWTDNNIDKWLDYCIKLVKNLHESTGRSIYLIPHIIEDNDNDYHFMQSVKKNLIDYPIFITNPHYSAQEVKYVISKLKCFVGARTHSTIAAFSSCVPTITLAYSMKAFGINLELYGDLTYCVSKDNFDINYVTELVNSAIIQNNDIRQKLSENLVVIKERSLNAGKIIQQIIG